MTYAEFYVDYLLPHIYLWLAAAFFLGLLLGLMISRAASKAKIRALQSRLEEYSSSVTDDFSGDDYVPAKLRRQDETAKTHITPDPSSADPGIDQLKGMQPKHQKKLKARGIVTLTQLLAATESRSQKEALADELQLEDFVVNKWVRMAELLSLPEMPSDVAEFLVFAGVTSAADLAERNAESLHHSLQNLNEKEQRISQVPTRQNIESWAAHIGKA